MLNSLLNEGVDHDIIGQLDIHNTHLENLTPIQRLEWALNAVHRLATKGLLRRGPECWRDGPLSHRPR